MSIDPHNLSLELLSGDRGHLPTGWSWNQSADPNRSTTLLWVVAGGNGTLDTVGRQHQLIRGACLLLDMRNDFLGRHDLERTLHLPWFVFRVKEAHKRQELHNTRVKPMHNIDFVVELLNRCADALNRTERATAELWFRVALQEILQQQSTPHELSDLGRYDTIQRASTFMRKNPQHRLPVAKMAAHAGYSPDHFIRLFKRHTGVTPNAFAVRARIDSARSLLVFSSYTVSEIADQLGYDDPYFFSRQFRGQTGQSPTAYRAAHR